MRVLLVVALAVLLAGCGGFVAEDVPTPTNQTSEPVPGDGAPAEETELTDSVDNPWGSETVEVGIVKTTNESRDIEPLVAETIEYWNTAGKEHATYDVNFTLKPDKSDVDVMVLLREDFDCGERTNDLTSGCAPRIDANSTVGERPQHVEIESGYTDEATVTIMKHEFGHVLGLRHDDEPQSFMQTRLELKQFPIPSHRERENPWGNDTVRYYVDWETHSGDRAASERQISETFAALESEAGDPISNATFVEVDEQQRANITIEFDTGECDSDGRSCRVHEGVDIDGQGDIDRLTTTTITLDEIAVERQGWHVGYWVANAFVGGDEDELPDEFVDTTPDERTDWWDG